MNVDQKLFSFKDMHFWERYYENLHIEFKQSMDEGRDVEEFKEVIEGIAKLSSVELREELADLIYKAMESAPQRVDYPYDEPSDLTGIKAKRPENRIKFDKSKISDREILKDKIHGAWLGRVCGCLLGKPIECIHTPQIETILKATNNYPLSRYIEKNDDLIKEFNLEDWRCWIDTVKGFAPMDDDTNYTALAALKIIEKHGVDFTPADVAKEWIENQSMFSYCTAERIAYKNIIAGMKPPTTATYKNVYREWIGAQIRADYYGYISPANPEFAAEMAWRDASISHTKNGIYGEMFVAAMLAAASVCDDINTVIIAGINEIPQKSRLYEKINEVINWYESGVTAKQCFANIHDQFDETISHDWCHTISNAMIVAASLLYGEKDYSKSICMSVEVGFDTDCNGATVGSVLGMMLGTKGIPTLWTDPVCDSFVTTIFGHDMIKISDIAEHTLKHIEKYRI